MSIVMTFASTVAAFGMLPLTSYVYTIPFREDRNIKIDFLQIFLATLLVVIPVLIGMAIKWKSDRIALIIEKVGTIGGVLAVVVALIFGTILNQDVLDSEWGLWMVSIILPLFGIFFGFFAARILKLSPSHQRTIALETGIQNSSLTIAIVAFSFEGEVREKVITVPLLYSVWLFIIGTLATLAFRFIIIRYIDKEEGTIEEITETEMKSAEEKVEEN